MKALIAILIIAAAGFLGWKIHSDWEDSQSAAQAERAGASTLLSGSQLPGMPAALEGTLDAATRRGAAGLRDFLERYSKSISDPRRAWIELDYAVLVARENPAEAKRVFAKVKRRTPPSSPVYPRIKQLEKTYE